jgi:trk system potassium uptake protein TrkH
MLALQRLGGVLWVSAPLLAVVAIRMGVTLGGPSRELPWTALLPTAALVLSVLLVSFTGAIVARAPRLGRWTLLLGAAALGVSVGRAALESAAATLAIASTVAVLIHIGAPTGAHERHDEGHEVRSAARVRAACAAAVVGGLVVLLLGGHRPLELAAVAATLLLASWTLLVALFRGQLRVSRWARRALSAAPFVALALVVVTWQRWEVLLAALTIVPAAGLVAVRPGRRSTIVEALAEAVLSHPARLLVVTFLILCAGGALLLKLPMSTTMAGGASAIDVMFTATSAVCVTGLAVLDTAGDFSGMGQASIALLIQLGGLGIMSFSTAAFALLGRRLSLRHEGAVADLVAHDRGDVFEVVKRMLAITFGIELAGALVLWPMFALAGDSAGDALWRAVFTSISAFCNAGFALQSTSLVPYQSMPWIVHVVAVLIILGGLSPAVVVELPRLMRGKTASVHSRVVLATSVTLLAVGAIIIGALEWSHGLGHLSMADRVHNAWFQGVTPRTAGFNSIDTGSLRPATLWLTLVLMFIGGSPGSTAGGIKTTTVALLFIAVRGAMRGRWEAVAFGRRFGDASVYKAAALTTIAAGTVVVAMVAILVTQPIPFEMALFEVVSALGTVGLSTGGTGMLDDVGKIVIIVCMFVGRVGPLTLFLFLRERSRSAPWRVPESELDVG